MLKQKRENRIVNCLVCWTCHGRIGPNHFTLKDGGAICGLCQAKNPLGNLRKLSMLDLTEPHEIWVPWTHSGTAAHALSSDGKTALGPWITFSSPETFERALLYIGMTEQQLASGSPARNGASWQRLHDDQRDPRQSQEPVQDRLEQVVIIG
ncbi:MAG TPA: hypothetical protein VK638_47565 [Edaphobacter sp.]|nr:hypothetical protein [Edaphobacter sp.]